MLEKASEGHILKKLGYLNSCCYQTPVCVVFNTVAINHSSEIIMWGLSLLQWKQYVSQHPLVFSWCSYKDVFLFFFSFLISFHDALKVNLPIYFLFFESFFEHFISTEITLSSHRV